MTTATQTTTRTTTLTANERKTLVEQTNDMRYKATMAQVKAAWFARATVMHKSTKTKAYADDRASYMYGVISAMVATGTMTEAQAAVIELLFSVGRADQWMAGEIG